MESNTRNDKRNELLAIVRRVRRRWRLKLTLRGAATSVAVGLLALLGGAYLLEATRFSPGVIIGLRVAIPLVIAGLVGYFMVRPLRRQVTDEQVALYLEEHEPSLETAIVSAVHATGDASAESPLSAALVGRLVESAIDKCTASGVDLRIEQGPVRKFGAVIAASVALGAAVVVFGPSYVRSALSALLLSDDVEAAAPYRLNVTPGNATVPKGADLAITALAQGFRPQQASLMARKMGTTTFEPLPLVTNVPQQFEGLMFDLDAATEYYVEADGVRSPTFTLTVVDLPYVKELELEYRFPVYTGLPPRKVEYGGDIAVLGGTEVHVTVTPTMAVPTGRLLLHEQKVAVLAKQADGTLTTSFVVDKDGFYRVELDAPSGERTAASPQYTIDVLTDEAPLVTFQKPGRDRPASPLEEVFVEARAQDDFGVRRLELVYSVNGGPETSVPLFEGRTRLEEVIAGHTFYLEELQVQPGDSVSYYARAADNSASAANRTTSDLYFLRIRPFDKDFRAAQSQGGGGGGGGGGAANEVNALSEQQRQIISATFNVQRDRRKLSADKLRENSVVVALSQSRLREQVQGLLTRMNSQLVERDPAFQRIAEVLPQAVSEMSEAESKLQRVDPAGALSPEQRALRFLQQAEEEYELQVTTNRNNGGGGGGGGGGSSVADELAGLFEQELDKMANQYETVQRAEEQSSEQRLDELMEKLKDLARRQEQEAERQRQLASQRSQGGASGSGGASSGGSSGGGSGNSAGSATSAAQQRALAEQAEAAARELERLSRDERQPDLLDAAKRLQEAAAAMRRAAASGDGGSAAQSAAALERLRETQRRLQQSRSENIAEQVDAATAEAEALSREQKSLSDEMRDLGKTEGRLARIQDIAKRKEALVGRVGELEGDIDQMAAAAGRNDREAARRLTEASDEIRDERVLDKLRYSKTMVERGVASESVRRLDIDVQASLDTVAEKLREAATALGQSKPDTIDTALDRARRLARGLESLEQRTQERLEQQAGDTPSRDGKASEDGKPGSGQQGGAPGQEGQPGEQAGPGGSGESGGQGNGQNADGNAGGGGAYGNGDGRGGWAGGWGYGDRRLGRLTEADIRQFRGELRQWIDEVRDLRGRLGDEELDPKELDAILRAMRELDDDRVYQNAEELLRRQTFVSEGLKRFEYGLRRRAEAREQGEVLVAGSDDVPEPFRHLVEQYYRSLSKDPR